MTTWWHIDEMNWHVNGVSDSLRIFSLVIAHVWLLAYTFEPLTIYLLHPHEPEANAPLPVELSEGPLLPATKYTLLACFYLGVAIWAVLFFNPAFANTRWPWELNPFDSRIMSAWPAGCAVWAFSMYKMKDWAEIKIGVRALLLFNLALFLTWAFNFSGFDVSRKNIYSVGAAPAVLSIALIYAYWKQQTARAKIRNG